MINKNKDTKFAPCIRSGYCCQQGPCAFGKSISNNNKACKYLEGNEPGNFACGIYDEIQALDVTIHQTDFSPAFGAGCCSTLNPIRLEMLRK